MNYFDKVDDNVLVDILIRSPFSCHAHLQLACRRFLQHIKSSKFYEHRKETNCSEWTLIGHIATGEHYILLDNKWTQCTRSPLLKISEWDSTQSQVCISGLNISGNPCIAHYDAILNHWIKFSLPEAYLRHQVSSCIGENGIIAIHSNPYNSCSVLALNHHDARAQWCLLKETRESIFVDEVLQACAISGSQLIAAGNTRLAAFDLKTYTWSLLPGTIPSDLSMCHHDCPTCAVELHGCIMGFRIQIIDSLIAFSKLFLYDLATLKFEAVPELPDGAPEVGFLLPMDNHILLIPFPHLKVSNDLAWKFHVQSRTWSCTKLPFGNPSPPFYIAPEIGTSFSDNEENVLQQHAYDFSHHRLYFDCIMSLRL